MFEHLDDPFPFEPDDGFRARVHARVRRRRVRRRWAQGTVSLVTVVALLAGGFAAYEWRRLDGVPRVDVGGLADHPARHAASRTTSSSSAQPADPARLPGRAPGFRDPGHLDRRSPRSHGSPDDVRRSRPRMRPATSGSAVARSRHRVARTPRRGPSPELADLVDAVRRPATPPSSRSTRPGFAVDGTAGCRHARRHHPGRSRSCACPALRVRCREACGTSIPPRTSGGSRATLRTRWQRPSSANAVTESRRPVADVVRKAVDARRDISTAVARFAGDHFVPRRTAAGERCAVTAPGRPGRHRARTVPPPTATRRYDACSATTARPVAPYQGVHQ